MLRFWCSRFPENGRILFAAAFVHGHDNCTDLQCVAYNNKKVTPLHNAEDCTCQNSEDLYEDIVRILRKRDCFPVLEITGNTINDVNIQVVESKPSREKYVALSHIWADGLGNSEINTLPRCQLIQMRNLVGNLYKQTSQGRVPLIWVDTICCPVGPPHGKLKDKIMALTKIKSVYENAEHVLVLDRGLQSYNLKDMGIVEAVLRVLTCCWNRRLWTLQEGALAKSLYFQFGDTASNFHTFCCRFQTATKDNFKFSGFERDIYDQFTDIWSFFQAPNSSDRPLNEKFI